MDRRDSSSSLGASAYDVRKMLRFITSSGMSTFRLCNLTQFMLHNHDTPSHIKRKRHTSRPMLPSRAKSSGMRISGARKFAYSLRARAPPPRAAA